jgi:alpha-beta hydrolase superfamily lysophospholipase
MRGWREHLYALNRAGFDVLAYDRRGEGLSGGFSDTNTLEQSEDIFRALEQMETGRGLRLLTPAGPGTAGRGGGRPADGGHEGQRQIPLLLLGNSRGTMATGWAMTKNYAGACTMTCRRSPAAAQGLSQHQGRDPVRVLRQRRGLPARSPDLADRNLFLGGMAADNYVAFYPNSAVLAEHGPLARGVLRQGPVGPGRKPGGHRRRLRPVRA